MGCLDLVDLRFGKMGRGWDVVFLVELLRMGVRERDGLTANMTTPVRACIANERNVVNLPPPFPNNFSSHHTQQLSTALHVLFCHY